MNKLRKLASRRRCLEQDENAENTNQPPPPSKFKLNKDLSQGFKQNQSKFKTSF
jgi:hypothetical protein